MLIKNIEWRNERIFKLSIVRYRSLQKKTALDTLMYTIRKLRIEAFIYKVKYLTNDTNLCYI